MCCCVCKPMQDWKCSTQSRGEFSGGLYLGILAEEEALSAFPTGVVLVLFKTHRVYSAWNMWAGNHIDAHSVACVHTQSVLTI